METLRPTPEKQFKPLNPEVVWGNVYRIPTITSSGGGSGFSLSEAFLPLEWETKINNLEYSPERFTNFYQEIAKDMGIKEPLNIYFDSQKILREMSFGNESPHQPKLEFAKEFFRVEKGAYLFNNVNNIKHGIIFHNAISRFFSYIDKENNYPYIEKDTGYYPVNLKIPKILLGKEGYTEYTQKKFLLKASNIAGRFGLDEINEEDIRYDKNGFIRYIEVHPGENGCYFSTTNSVDGSFGCHNVDTARQALALFSIIISQYNDKLSYME